MKTVFLSTAFFLITMSCFGQIQERENMLSLNLGVSYITRQDLIFSPFIHTDFSPLSIGIEYTRDQKLFQKASLRYGNFDPMLTSPYEFTLDGETNTAYPHSFNLIDIDYLIGKKAKESNSSIFTVGGLFEMDVQALNYAYGNSNYFGYYSALSLGIFGRYQYTVNGRSTLASTLQLPLLAWQARSPYLVNDDEFIENQSSHSGFKTFTSFLGDGQLVTLNQWQALDLDVKYLYDLNEKWKIGAGYLFEFIHASQSRNLLSFRHSFNLSANLSF